jgi:hypothetical protein
VDTRLKASFQTIDRVPRSPQCSVERNVAACSERGDRDPDSDVVIVTSEEKPSSR